ncbi:hypothetical protein [Flavobacterium sp.]|uniref:hypothetical protein n=1 Tax=Flavobacterium sp. TaxID=239 RepID=UPI002B4AE40F|nr:hypothetical protein [Flavobacterium sp.]HLF52988.1 hypothetical protein [Flavobacterium sp.]
MKNSIIYLGIALLSITNSITASNVHQSFIKNDDSSFSTKQHSAEVVDSKVIVTEISNDNDSTIKVFSLVEDTSIFNPDTVVFNAFERTIEEVIAENNQIIENGISNEISFLYIEKSTEEIIAEDNEIIESTISTEVQPLQIEKTIEEIIIEDNKIIESTISNEFQPLDFEKIKEI